MDRLRKLLTQTLLAFALVSVGFVLGKHTANPGQPNTDLHFGKGAYVVVYYMHATFRCDTCNTIEKMTKALLDVSYRQELTEGRVRRQETDFQEEEALAKKFGVVASCVVVAEVRNGEVVNYQRLDEVWTLMKDPPAFNKYISNAIDEYLERTGA